jgi:D-alanyl-D-alanine carboxypeptidase
LDRGFANNGLAWLRPSLGIVNNLVPIDASPPNLRDEMCGGRHHKPASDEDDAGIVASNAGTSSSGETGMTFFAAGLQAPLPKPSEWLAASPAPSEPIPVYTGPTKSGAALIAAVASDSEKQTTRRGKRSRVAAKRPDASVEAKSDARPPVRHVNNARPDAKPAAATEAKPAKPKTAAKPSKPKSTSGETKPAG